MLRRRWKDFAVLAGLFVLICVCLALPSATSPLWRGDLLGFCAGLVAAIVTVLVLLLDGSLLRRIGRGVDVMLAIRCAESRGSLGWSVRCCSRDASRPRRADPLRDLGVEVKWSMTPVEELDRVWGLPGHLEQPRQAARQVRGLVCSSSRDIPVHPVLVLFGPGMPALGPGTVREGVRVVISTSRKGWQTLLAEGEAVWTLGEAKGAADALVRLRDARIHYEGQRT